MTKFFKSFLIHSFCTALLCLWRYEVESQIIKTNITRLIWRHFSITKLSVRQYFSICLTFSLIFLFFFNFKATSSCQLTSSWRPRGSTSKPFQSAEQLQRSLHFGTKWSKSLTKSTTLQFHVISAKNFDTLLWFAKM